ncbi:MAG TPA: hypothetical protein VF158_10755 [Longimicrobiales bacterium]
MTRRDRVKLVILAALCLAGMVATAPYVEPEPHCGVTVPAPQYDPAALDSMYAWVPVLTDVLNRARRALDGLADEWEARAGVTWNENERRGT